MTEENSKGFETSLGFTALSAKPSRKKKSSAKVSQEKVEEVSVKEEVVEEVEKVEEVVEYEPPAPSAPTPPSPVVAPGPAKPWKPLVRPLKKTEGNQGISRSDMRRTR